MLTENAESAQMRGSLAPPTYLLPLNFHFTSVLGLGLLHMQGFLGGQIFGGTEGVAENDDVEVARQFQL